MKGETFALLALQALALQHGCNARALPRDNVPSVNTLSDETINLVKQRLAEVAVGRYAVINLRERRIRLGIRRC